MQQFIYESEGGASLGAMDLYGVFNKYRIYKYVIWMLMMLGKTDLPAYKILEPGCGGGHKLRWLTELRAKPSHLFGFDISKRAVEITKSLSPADLNLQVASAMDMPFRGDTFDIILLSSLFSCFKNMKDIVWISSELRRVLKNDGCLLVIEINENFPKAYANQGSAFVDSFKYFDTTVNELETTLAGTFEVFKRINLFSQEIYKVNDQGASRLVDVKELPLLDQGLDEGDIASAYCLYSFLPKKR